MLTDTGVKPFSKFFLFSSAAILTITGTAKILSAWGDSKILTVGDPVTGIPFGGLITTVGLVEIAIALTCLLCKRQAVSLGFVAWFSTNVVAYRVGLWGTGWKKPCNCLGNLTDVVHISPQTADSIMKVLLVYLLLGSYHFLIPAIRHKRIF